MTRARGGHRAAARLAAAVLVLALTGCATASGEAAAPAPGGSPSSDAPGTGATGEVVVFAAASLTEAFDRIGAGFEAANPAASVTFSFAASSGLAQQIVSGAPADVFASASPAPMQQVVDADAARGAPTVFARNRLQIAVPPGNPGHVTGLADLADPDRTVALCAEQVPCGAAAVEAFRAAGLVPAPDTLEQDVKAALTKVELGEVDAALVYRTDVLAAGDRVEGLAFPEADQAVNDYPLAGLADARNPEGARAFVDYVLSPAGQEVLADAGFDRP
jgi:molybdate transport system substrate-binding protein